MRKKKNPQPSNPENLTQTNKNSGDSQPQTNSPFANPERLREKLWGKDPNTYGTLDELVYKERLSKMTKWDLMQECTKRGLVPHDDNNRMIKRLMGGFKEFITVATRGSKTPHHQNIKIPEKTKNYINSILG